MNKKIFAANWKMYLNSNESKEFMLKVNAKTKLFGVLADPIEHVRAPDIYNERWIYNNKNQLMIPIHVKKENLQLTIEGLRSLSNFWASENEEKKIKKIRFLILYNLWLHINIQISVWTS